LTFWGGLLFLLGHEKEGSVNDDVQIFMTVCLVIANALFLIGSFLLFAREYMKDRKTKLIRRSSVQQVVPIVSINSVQDDTIKLLN
jgi:hypothetical protein